MEVGKRPGGEEQGHERVRVSRVLLHKGYMKLEPSGSVEQELPPKKHSGSVSFGLIAQKQQRNQRKKWRFRVRPKVRVLYSTISTLAQRVRNSYCARVMLALLAKARETSLFPVVGGSKKKQRTTVIGNDSIFHSGRGRASGCDLSNVEMKYLDYIKRSVTDGELAYYTMSLRTTSIL